MSEVIQPAPTRSPAPGRQPSGALVAELGRLAAETLKPLIRADAPCALIDFPTHTNLGDSAIWLGQLALLRRLGLPRPSYACDYMSYSRARLAARIGDGTILISGGGNFGDLYPHHQRLREAVIADFPHNPIVQLPQSIHFTRPAGLEQVARLCDAHRDFTLLVRDHASHEAARRTFRSPVVLCPDMAFGLGALPRRGAPDHDIVFIARRDREMREVGPAPAALPGMLRTDWLRERETLVHRIRSGLRRQASKYPHADWLDRLASRSDGPLARHRLLRGVTMLSRGRVVITDRLHAHILSLLLGVPHCLLDNSYGKVRGCWETWTHGAEPTVWCNSEAEALVRVRELLASEGSE
ncbi:MAG TPA: polysaccharide pyruvyl transferase family protein [Gemmatimonadales bacterium]|nr:polysaccharide pyruvyl transferase family protein [Gemmatimonadales bacterium]